MSRTVARALLSGALCFLTAPAALAEEQVTPAEDLARLDLSGAWYVLIHYKDERSEDPSITKFRDFAWSIEQTANSLSVEYYPVVLFDEETEIERRHAMRGHQPWQPSQANLAALARSLDVSSRAMTSKRMTGSVAEGFRSRAPVASGGLNIVSFTKSWDVRFEPEAIQIVVTDSLSATAGLEGSEDSTVYRITERFGPNELRGTYEEASRRGSIRMIRAGQRRVVK